MRSLARLLLALLGPALACLSVIAVGCSFDDVELEGLPCPCPQGLSCDPVSNTCTRGGCSSENDGTPCVDDRGTCRAGVCCFGCWDGARCVDGETLKACGARGEACTECSCPGDSCNAGKCAPKDPARNIAVGEAHACVVTQSSRLFCWGRNEYGQAGQGEVPASHTGNGPGVQPDTAAIEEIGDPSFKWRSVFAGLDSTCAIRDDVVTGNRYCWGMNKSKALGLGTNTPGGVTEPSHPNDESWNFGGIAMGDSTSCGRLDIGHAICWGDDAHGETRPLGACSTPRPQMEIPPDHIDPEPHRRYRKLSMYNHHVCAIDLFDELTCWGMNQQGQLGVGTLQDVTCGIQKPMPGMSVHDATAGSFHSCAITRNDRALWCWGGNKDGQLGLGEGHSKSEALPRLVDDTRFWEEVVAGDNLTCARALRRAGTEASGGAVFCFGNNSTSQVGVPEVQQVRSPTQLGDFTSHIQVRIGKTSGCAIRAGGSLWCWGGNGSGQLAEPASVTSSPIPVRICPQ